MDVSLDYSENAYIRNHLPRRKSLRCPITVEPLLFLIFFAISCTDSIVTNLLEERTCIQYMNFPADVCTKQLSPEIEKLVQPNTTKIIMTRAEIEAFIPAMLSFFIGPWSDMNGRKTFLVSSFLGYGLCYLMWGIMSLFSNLSPYLFLLTTLPVAFSGGLVAIFTCSFCYISDVTNNNNRAFRMAVLECCLVLGILLGYFTSSKIFELAGHYYGYITVFFCASGGCFLALFYTLLFLPETINASQFQENRIPLLNVSHLSEMFTVLFSKRPRYGRAQILLMACICGMTIMIVQGEPSIKFLSVRDVFSWNMEQYNYYSAACSLIAIVASLVGIWLLNFVLNLPGFFITLIATTMGTASGILMSISTTGLDFFISTNLSCFGALVGPLLRTELSKIVPQRDLGKVYAFTSSLEALTPLIGAPSYTQLYNYLLSSMPLAVYFLTSGIWLFNTILLLIVIGMKLLTEDWKGATYEDDDEEPLESGVDGP